MVSLQEIKLGKHTYPIHFGQATFADFCDIRDISEREMWQRLIGDDVRPGDWVVLIWAALFHGARRHSGNPMGDPDFKLTQYDVADLLNADAYKSAAELLRKSLPVTKADEEGNLTAQGSPSMK